MQVPLFIARLFNIPVAFETLFGRPLPEGEFGQMLDGDSSMPSTFIEGRWVFLNPIRNAVLATFVWREYSLLDLGHLPRGGVYLMFGNGNVMPSLIHTRFIAVKHGREACRFAVVDRNGLEVPFTVLGRRDRDGVRQGVIEFVQDLSSHDLASLFVRELNEADDRSGGLTPSERLHEVRECLACAINEGGESLVTFV